MKIDRKEVSLLLLIAFKIIFLIVMLTSYLTKAIVVYQKF
jgi:hypothetical protein